MKKKLSEMTLEELWRLFPVFLVAPKEEWAISYAEEKTRLLSVLSDMEIKRISHIGSTAIKGIWAKDIVDIMIELPEDEEMTTVAEKVARNGYIEMNRTSSRISLNRGYTEEGFAERVFHLHLRYAGDNNELYFRDYLNDHPDLAREYEKLKLSLWKKYEHDRDGYTQAKTDFVKDITKKAKAEYGFRYAEKQ